jgi:hypothetical protein
MFGKSFPNMYMLTCVCRTGSNVSGIIRQGYVLSKNGITVGLTSANTKRFSKTKLLKNENSKAECGIPNWHMPQMSIAINNQSNTNHGSALFDTGIKNSFITVSDNIYNSLHLKKKKLTDGNTVYFNVTGVDNTPRAKYKVTMGDHDTMQLFEGYTVSLFNSSNPHGHDPFINTGRYFYKIFDSMYDAKYGCYGLYNRTAPHVQTEPAAKGSSMTVKNEL